MFPPLIFERCPICSSKKTASRLACNEERSIPKDPALAVGLAAPAIISHFDICANCGPYYCTKVEMGNIPVQVKQTPGSLPPFFPKGS